MKSPVSLVVAVLTGLIILIGYFFPNPILMSIRTPLLDWVVILSGVAGIVGILHLIFGEHLKRIKETGPQRWFSLVVIFGFLATVIAGLFLGPTNIDYQKIVTLIQVPVESSLLAVLAVTMSFASLKFLQRQRNWMGVTFLLSVAVFLILNSGIFSFTASIPVLQDILSGFQKIPTAGARGILIGVALGSIATGIRILIGSDRPYSR
jgi:hypothetical protein